jgi:hypothetical protein
MKTQQDLSGLIPVSYHPSFFLTELERRSKKIEKTIRLFKLCEI